MTNLSTDLHDVEKIIVLDYGSQYNQLISRRIREIGVFSELKSHKISADEVLQSILSGSYFQADQTLFTKKDHLILIQRFLNLEFRF